MSTVTPLAIGARLRLARRALGLTQIEFARRAGISPTAMNNYERGRNFVGVPHLVAILEAHDVSIDWLCTGNMRQMRYDLAEKIKALLNEEES